MHVPATFALFDPQRNGVILVIFFMTSVPNTGPLQGGASWLATIDLLIWGHHAAPAIPVAAALADLAAFPIWRGPRSRPRRDHRPVADVPMDVPKSRSDNRQQEQQRQRRLNIRKVKQSQGKILRTSVVTKWFDFKKRCLFWGETMIFGDYQATNWSAIKKPIIRNQTSNDRWASRIVKNGVKMRSLEIAVLITGEIFRNLAQVEMPTKSDIS